MGAEERLNGEVRVREFQFVADAPQVAEILREAKEATLWTETDLLLLRDLSGATAFVSVSGDGVSGIVIGRKVTDEAEILNLAVREPGRRKGAGSRLVERLLQQYSTESISRVFLEVRESNTGAIRFYESLGFQTVGRRKDYYPEPREDALVMEHSLGKSTEPPR
jgi:[ribosomal protein S18]-alanine N-acetyltransferase